MTSIVKLHTWSVTEARVNPVVSIVWGSECMSNCHSMCCMHEVSCAICYGELHEVSLCCCILPLTWSVY